VAFVQDRPFGKNDFLFKTYGADVCSVIETYAGGGPNNMWALSANVVPSRFAVDGQGNLFISDASNHRVLRVDAATHAITPWAGSGNVGFSGDGGPATEASLYGPAGIAVDPQGNLFIADEDNSRVRRVDAVTHIITSYAGNGTAGSGGDGGAATAASLIWPAGVALDAQGNLFIADAGDHRIRRVDATTHNISPWAGTGTAGSGGDGGPATAASLIHPTSVAVDAHGNLFIADEYNHRVRRVDAVTHIITPYAGNGTEGFSGDGGPATAASFYQPTDIAVDAQGNLFIADKYNHRVRRVDAQTHTIEPWAGNGAEGFSGDGGPATAASLIIPSGVAVDAQGNVFIADQGGNYRVRRVGAVTPHVITTVIGNGTEYFSGDCGPATDASLQYPVGVAVDARGNVFIADQYNHRVRRVDATTRTVTTVAGNGNRGFSGDGGPATEASLDHPAGVAVDAQGNLFIADQYNRRVRRVDALTPHIITTWAGNENIGIGGDGGPATEASLITPTGVAVDAHGNLFIADSGTQRVRRVDVATHIITSWAGNGTAGFSGDGGPATDASLFDPLAVAVDARGDVFIADEGNHRIRRVDALDPHIITTWAGNESAGFSGDGGPATAASLNHPAGVAVDANGNVFIADEYSHRIRRVDALAPRVITTWAGQGTSGFSGDGGAPTNARLTWPMGIALDAQGNLFIADHGNHRVRRISK